MSLVCDGKNDCKSGQDEANCTGMCCTVYILVCVYISKNGCIVHVYCIDPVHNHICL